MANRGRVFRVGDTVHRPVTPSHPATHALLAHLHHVGFTGAARVLATTAEQEMLSWIPGSAAGTPLPAWAHSDEVLASIAELVRRFHDAARFFDGSAHRWPDPAVPVPFRGRLVSHNDLHPGNIVFAQGRAVGLIDFDLAGPGSPVWDLATLARNWCPLTVDQDTPGPLREHRMARFARLLDAYGLPRADRLAVVDALVPNHDWTYRIVTDAVAQGHPGFSRYWSRTQPRAQRARDWLVARRSELQAVSW